MTRHGPSILRRFMPCFLAIMALGTAASGPMAQSRQWIASELRADWIESNTWGGGFRLIFDLPERRDQRSRSFSDLGGGAVEYTLGCNTRRPETSIWRFRVGTTPPGTAINKVPGAERAHELILSEMFGQGGVVTLVDELEKPFASFPLRPAQEGLETTGLSREQVKLFGDASRILVSTPVLSLTGSTNMLGAIRGIEQRLPCNRR